MCALFRTLRIGGGGGGGDGPSPSTPPRLSAGSAHTLALCPTTARVLVWGANTEGQLGLGADAEETVYLPTVLDLRLGPEERAKQVVKPESQ